MTYIDPDILLEGLRDEMRAICQFSVDQEFTMKWIDEEGIYGIIALIYLQLKLFNFPLQRIPVLYHLKQN